MSHFQVIKLVLKFSGTVYTISHKFTYYILYIPHIYCDHTHLWYQILSLYTHTDLVVHIIIQYVLPY